MNPEIFSYIAYIVIGSWAVWSAYYILKLKKKKEDAHINEYLYHSIPSVFTTLGVLGTFGGIYLGLRKFDVDFIDESIPELLEGLKMAFSTSILGISLSIIFGKWSQVVLKETEEVSSINASEESIVLTKILGTLNLIANAIQGEGDSSITTHFEKLRNKINDQNKELSAINSALGGEDDTSLLSQIQKLRLEQNDQADKNRENVEFIVESMNKNNELIKVKFEEFTKLLAKSNTEALVEVMKKATEDFNAQMSDLINKLVQENFAELNNSVKSLNDWQKENKEMIVSLTNQFKQVSEDFTITSKSINEITTNTSKLTDKNSHLTKLIEELQKVMIEDKKFQAITEKLTTTIDILKTNTESFNDTSNNLNKWIDKQKTFSDSVARLLIRLEEIDQIKDINEVFWADTKKQLNEGVNIISKASENLNSDIENINQEFYDRLNDTLQNLDNLIKSIIESNR